jgi:hypothetical protein
MKKNILILFLSLFFGITAQGQLIINEVLYDPSNNLLDGDANGDGIYSQTQDEFIELVNIGTSALNVSGYQIWDDTLIGTAVYTIPNGTIIPPQGALIIFGGGTPIGLFGGAIVLVDNDSTGLSFANSGEKIAIKNNTGTTILTFDSDALSNNPNESYTRNPDLTGSFVQHASINTLKFTPGKKVNGDNFITLTTKQVTFRVDLNKYIGSFDSVFVVGNFNQQCNNCNPLLDINRDGMWELSLPVSTDTIEYFFNLKLGSNFIREQFPAINACTKLSGSSINRFANISKDTVLQIACFQSCTRCAIELSLKGVTDFITPLGGSTGKAIHLVADSAIANLSIYGIGVANNGNGSNGQEYRFPRMSVPKGSQIMVVRDSAVMAAYMSTCWSNIALVLIDSAGVINQNGNDAVELFKVGEAIETFGDINQNGTGQPWEYTGSWAFKNNFGAWIYGGIRCTDSSSTIFDSKCIYPLCNLIQVDSIQVNGEANGSIINTNGGTLKMLATVFPSNAVNKNVGWSVNNTSIATISNEGILTAISNGTVIVKATAKDAGGAQGLKSVTITNQLVKVSSIVVAGEGNDSTITQNGGTLKMIATVLPTDAANKEVNWSVNDEDIASINTEGLLTALANGTVIVRATAKDGSNIEGSKIISITGQSNGLNDVQQLNVKCYPNPVENILYIQSEKEVGEYNLYTIYGKLLEKGLFEFNQLDLSSLETGLYIMDVKVHHDWVRYKIMKK